MIIGEGADRFQFMTPYRGIKPLRIPRTEVAPFNLQEIKLILENVQEPFRPYQTRHTAATLWLAAGENPEWIARQLGHSAQMLFSTYARFVPNLTRRDGSAFEALLDDAL